MPKQPKYIRALTNVQSNVIHLCAQARRQQAAEASYGKLAVRAKVTKPTVERWESGKWGEAAPQILDAYFALVPGLDPEDVWLTAARHWRTPMPGSPKSRAGGAVRSARAGFPRADGPE